MPASQPKVADKSRTPRQVRSPGRLRAMLFVGLANLGLALLIGTSYLDDLPVDPQPRIWWFAHAGLVSSLLTLTLMPGVGLALAALSRISDRSLVIAQALTWSCFHLTLFIDTRVYGLYHYHLNGAAWNLLTTRGSQDSYHLGLRIWLLGAGLFAAFALAQWLLWKLAWLRIERTQDRRSLRPAALWIVLFATSVGVEKTIYAGADLNHDRQVVALSHLFPLYPRLSVAELMPREGRWNDRVEHMGTGLTGRTLGVVGAGRIGKELLRLAKMFDLKLLAADPYAEELELGYLGARKVSLETLLAEADFVVVTALLNEETRHLLSAKQLALMKPTAYLINVARGPVVDEKALYDVLSKQKIAGAGLDVFEEEPTPASNPILKLDNVIVAPHSLCWTDELFSNIARTAVGAVLAVHGGRAPQFVVDPAALAHPRARAWLK
jgi:phosphoglycerate dehydrogenase-like enzyme